MKQRLLQLNLFLSEWKGRVPFTFMSVSLLLGGLTMPEWKGRVPLTRSHCERITITIVIRSNPLVHLQRKRDFCIIFTQPLSYPAVICTVVSCQSPARTGSLRRVSADRRVRPWYDSPYTGRVYRKTDELRAAARSRPRPPAAYLLIIFIARAWQI
ncbi:hypothetical protein EVAR_60059_1 [Eumeta japonica]|uniref:Uncharacterized protein n=1 Tax=Eumeta variegata TaxID=151549 RepID=A0A4C1ZN58_EUMVA|nr:hypothetical protein EVAR_60059_1 [Eumeta japonica]